MRFIGSKEYSDIIVEKSNITPTNIFEIGTGNIAESGYFQQRFNISLENIYCFEPNPLSFKNVKESYPKSNVCNVAVSNIDGKKSFQCHRVASDISSFRKRIVAHRYTGDPLKNYDEIMIEVCRMDSFIKSHNIDQIDICKIDVEGCTCEVLEGFGDKLNIVKSLHVEAENNVLYEDQKLFKDVKNLLNGFTMIDYVDLEDGQCDSVWIRNDLLKT